MLQPNFRNQHTTINTICTNLTVHRNIIVGSKTGGTILSVYGSMIVVETSEQGIGLINLIGLPHKKMTRRK